MLETLFFILQTDHRLEAMPLEIRLSGSNWMSALVSSSPNCSWIARNLGRLCIHQSMATRVVLTKELEYLEVPGRGGGCKL